MLRRHGARAPQRWRRRVQIELPALSSQPVDVHEPSSEKASLGARQASRGGEAEGYSIPAQREACGRKATDLGAEVDDEYVDAGASARSADRPALQALLRRLLSDGDVDFVIVHKVDRLARDRADDVAIGLAIHQAGAVLVSASEPIGNDASGSLLHGKAQRGGTPGTPSSAT